jgi:hypothetical protein
MQYCSDGEFAWDSNMLNSTIISEESEGLSEKELQSRGVFSRYLFKIG